MNPPVAPVERVILQPSGPSCGEVRCPYCDRLHTHGAGPGHRWAHCGASGGHVLHLDQDDAEVVANCTTSRRHR